MDGMLIYDVGYSAFRVIDEIIKFLKLRGIEVVVDVRAFPRSKLPGFSSDELRKSLEANGIEYLWLGDKLGGYRKGGYEKYMKRRDFEEGIRALLSVVSKRRACLLCLERKRRACHRRFIIDKLRELGFIVKDLVEDREDV
ncbi:MAG: DUF488 domain-containing protein [Candidatus Nezhaarchaeota archaeon]|nr:DUF488 domain-containing protein [Candidatus Nezhaarchaeota archaeon]MCX8141962.1 DUF488 domain-containing protein [Candidatus Nezhaarchaeota archaeon]MDW8050257.1 DUF488 domain-containing protein [Nitrososphaerota archaeon]